MELREEQRGTKLFNTGIAKLSQKDITAAIHYLRKASKLSHIKARQYLAILKTTYHKDLWREIILSAETQSNETIMNRKQQGENHDCRKRD